MSVVLLVHQWPVSTIHLLCVFKMKSCPLWDSRVSDDYLREAVITKQPLVSFDVPFSHGPFPSCYTLVHAYFNCSLAGLFKTHPVGIQ